MSCLNQVNKIFEEYDFLALPSAQVYPFDKKLQYPEYINGEKLDTYHRWLEVFVLSSLLELPTITVPVGFNKNEYWLLGRKIKSKTKRGEMTESVPIKAFILNLI